MKRRLCIWCNKLWLWPAGPLDSARHSWDARPARASFCTKTGGQRNLTQVTSVSLVFNTVLYWIKVIVHVAFNLWLLDLSIYININKYVFTCIHICGSAECKKRKHCGASIWTSMRAIILSRESLWTCKCIKPLCLNMKLLSETFRALMFKLGLEPLNLYVEHLDTFVWNLYLEPSAALSGTTFQDYETFTVSGTFISEPCMWNV